jgi:hypothetical protein
MTTFKEIRGTAIQSVSSDPTNPEVGQIWYNNTIGVLKGYKVLPGTWASGGNRSTARTLSASAGASVSANLSFGGYNPSTFSTQTATEEYDGTSWTAGGSLNSPLGLDSAGGCGTQTAALSATGKSGGAPTGYIFPAIANSFEYDGSTWTSGGNVSLARTVTISAGTQTSALIAGGQPDSPPGTNTTEEYDGSAWTAGGNLPQVIHRGTGTGTQTATIQAGGHQENPTSTDLNVTNYYNGTSWTAQTAINTARNALGSAGIQTSAVIYGGYQYTNPPVGGTAATETWDGIAWTTQTGMPVATPTPQSPTSTSASDALALTGQTTTAEWTGPSLATQKITTS